MVFNSTKKKPCTFNPSNFLLDQKVTIPIKVFVGFLLKNLTKLISGQDKTKLPPALSNRKSHGKVGQNETLIESYNLSKGLY
jgi:hypothetical protein